MNNTLTTLTEHRIRRLTNISFQLTHTTSRSQQSSPKPVTTNSGNTLAQSLRNTSNHTTHIRSLTSNQTQPDRILSTRTNKLFRQTLNRISNTQSTTNNTSKRHTHAPLILNVLSLSSTQETATPSVSRLIRTTYNLPISTTKRSNRTILNQSLNKLTSSLISLSKNATHTRRQPSSIPQHLRKRISPHTVRRIHTRLSHTLSNSTQIICT